MRLRTEILKLLNDIGKLDLKYTEAHIKASIVESEMSDIIEELASLVNEGFVYLKPSGNYIRYAISNKGSEELKRLENES